MKKFLFSLFAISAFFTSCGSEDEPINHGSVSLDKTSQTLIYEGTVILTPSYSGDVAKGKDYTWASSDNNIATVEVLTGGKGKVTAKRVGETDIIFAAKDGTISARCKVTVNPRSVLLGGIYFVKDASTSDIKAQVTVKYTEYPDSIVCAYGDTNPISKIIYELSNSRLASTLVVLKPSSENQELAEEFIEERFIDMKVTTEGIKYYDASNLFGYKNTKVGIFENKGNYKLGVKYTGK